MQLFTIEKLIDSSSCEGLLSLTEKGHSRFGGSTMTKGAARIFAAKAAILPTKLEPEIREKVSSEETEDKITIEAIAFREKIESRFARLKKSLRKKAVSIL